MDEANEVQDADVAEGAEPSALAIEDADNEFKRLARAAVPDGAAADSAGFWGFDELVYRDQPLT